MSGLEFLKIENNINPVFTMYNDIVQFIRETYSEPEKFITLHEPSFVGNERKYVNECIDTGFVSSVGKFVDRFEDDIKAYTGAKYAVATVNGTAALHMALILAGVKRDELVLVQALTFIATCNAISYIGAEPVFLDIDLKNLGMSMDSLENFLNEKTVQKDGACYHKETGKRVAACVPMHTFGHPVEIDRMVELCNKNNIVLIEDAAESIGSTYKGKHTGTFGTLGTYSFNGNKTITCGGGGIIVTNDETLGKLGKHLTTQAKVPHRWEFNHDHIGYNYRLPNLNAALACAQLENLEMLIAKKRELSAKYEKFFEGTTFKFITEPENVRSNYWLNAILVSDRKERDEFLTALNDSGVMARPAWTLMNKLPMFKHCMTEDLTNAQYIEDRLVNIPSSPIL